MTHFALDDYHRQLIRLNRTRKRMELLYTKKQVKLSDVLALYEALFLRAVVGFEQFCEVLFFEIAHDKTRYPTRKVSRRITATSRTAMRELLLSENDYLKWLPYKETEKRAVFYFNGGRPFTNVDDGDRSQLSTICRIRNAIAHASDHAIGEFVKKVIGNQNLLRSERTPAGYLRSPITPQQRRFEVYLASLHSIAGKILGSPLA